MIKKYFLNILISFDRLWNTILLANNDETISSRAGRGMNTSLVAFKLCKLLYRIDKDHCKKSIEAYRNKTAINDKPIAGFIMFIAILTTSYIVFLSPQS